FVRRLAAPEERCEQSLEALHQDVGLLAVVGQAFDLGVLHENLVAQKCVLAFKSGDEPLVGLRSVRDRTRLFASSFTGLIDLIYAMCLSIEYGATRYFSPNSVSVFRQSSFETAQ